MARSRWTAICVVSWCGESTRPSEGAESHHLLTINATVQVTLEFVVEILHWSYAKPETTLFASSVGTKMAPLSPPPESGSFLSASMSFCSQSVRTPK